MEKVIRENPDHWYLFIKKIYQINTKMGFLEKLEAQEKADQVKI